MDLSFLPKQNTSEDNKKFEACRYTKKEISITKRLFYLRIKHELYDYYDYDDDSSNDEDYDYSNDL